MRVFWLRLRILALSLLLEYRRGCMYRIIQVVSKHQNRLRALKVHLATIDCPRRALRVVAARKDARLASTK